MNRGFRLSLTFSSCNLFRPERSVLRAVPGFGPSFLAEERRVPALRLAEHVAAARQEEVLGGPRRPAPHPHRQGDAPSQVEPGF